MSQKVNHILLNILRYVSDEAIEEIAAEFNDLSILIAAINELLRSAKSDHEVMKREKEIFLAFDQFLEDILNNTEIGKIDSESEKLQKKIFVEYGRKRGWLKPAPKKHPAARRLVDIYPPVSQEKMRGGPIHEQSALKMFGYTVGKTSGWPMSKRWDFLSCFMEQELPDFVEEKFPGEYGLPLSKKRLKKVADVISTNCGNFRRNNPDVYAQAISDWEEDLMFLKRKYYIGHNLNFGAWPDSRIRL